MKYSDLTLTLTVTLALVVGCAKAPSQKTFAAPDDAVVAFVDAVKTNDRMQLDAILGPDGKKLLSSGDDVADQQAREVFLIAYQEKAELNREENRSVLSIGNEEWPFPIPLVRDGNSWRFDTAAGVDEILFRRIGRNELDTLQLCTVYVQAQMEYAAKARDGKPAGLYAQKFRSSPGKHDGLYWQSQDPNDSSPLGDLAAQAAEEGYSGTDGKPTPFHGYYFRILNGRGASASGGALSYLANGEMRGGFALLAYPAEYKNSGIMTFIIDDRGTAYQKDLGADTSKLAVEIGVFDPDQSWEKAELE